ncbi:hypothetical protein AK830_g9039 [Neonectria ditissima]|uniref:SnoaL-like domain-containing protein n=1 Tax=Neonectria ditissima TaxID=78410 RepID=A0A0P7AJ58_9HYPO|nr:hypothetical protein AK830_g9039 [Neonectria ditissima]
MFITRALGCLTAVCCLSASPLLCHASSLPSRGLSIRQSSVKPLPCQPVVPAPDSQQTEGRFNKFAHAFLLTKNLTEAFAYITNDYINHNPFADDGFDVAFDFLSPVWPNTTISLRRTLFEGDTGWLNYNASGVGEVIDRFRWEDGCIVEHWDVGEVWPQ